MDLVKKFNPFKRLQSSSHQQQQTHPAHHHQHQQPTGQQTRRDSSNKRNKAAEKELQHLNQKIEKLLANLDENESESSFAEDEECVVCLSAKATMKTYPCEHCVVCRKCFVKTIQTAVTDRCLPLKCVVCRTKVLKLKQQTSAPRSLQPPPPITSSSSSSSSSSSHHHHLDARRTAFGPPTPAIPPHPPVTTYKPRSSSVGKSIFFGGGHQRKDNQSTAIQPSLRPTATRLMQPLLIYPAGSGTGGDRSGPQRTYGWGQTIDESRDCAGVSGKISATEKGMPGSGLARRRTKCHVTNVAAAMMNC